MKLIDCIINENNKILVKKSSLIQTSKPTIILTKKEAELRNIKIPEKCKLKNGIWKDVAYFESDGRKILISVENK